MSLKTLTNDFLLFLDGAIVEKSALYWPLIENSSQTFGHIEVTNLHQDEDCKMSGSTVRSLHLKGDKNSKHLLLMPIGFPS